jgi:hypothetical protein
MESREHGTAPIAPRHWRKSFISLWLATPRASLARIRQAIATKQLRHGLTGADVQFSGTASQCRSKSEISTLIGFSIDQLQGRQARPR